MMNYPKAIRDLEEKISRNTESAKSLGAQKSAGFIGAMACNPKMKFRVKYGYFTPGEGDYGEPKYIEAADFDDAQKKYKELGWFDDPEPGKGRYKKIETSEDDFKTIGGSLFHDTRRF